MKKNDYIFLIVSTIFAIAFMVNLIFQVLPEKQAIETFFSRESRRITPETNRFNHKH
jgi:hypothetical protein